MYFFQGYFVLTAFLHTFFEIDQVAGNDKRENSDVMDYNWDAIRHAVQKLTPEQNEYSTSRDGWAEIHRRQQMKKLAGQKSCQVIPPSLEETIDNILQSPRAKLFTQADKTGNVEQYDFNVPTFKGGCYNLKEFPGRIKFVDSDGTCVRLFSGPECRLWSQAIYPGSTNIPNVKLEGVKSVGPCITNEFQHSAIIKLPSSSAVSPQLEKLPSALESFENVPDLIHDGLARSGATAVDVSYSNPALFYLLGPGRRVEALGSRIHEYHLRSPESTEKARVAGLKENFYFKLELEESDEPGFAIPLELGGPGDKIYNVFPQDQKQVGYFKAKIVPWVKEFLSDYPSQTVWWTVNFVYKNSTSARPAGMWYWGARTYPNNNEILYGYVSN